MGKLTEGQITRVSHGTSDGWLGDGNGLWLRLYPQPSTRKMWVIRSRRGGKWTTRTLGPYPAWTIKRARFEATKFQLNHQPGGNPNLSVAEAADEWFRTVIEPRYKRTKNMEVYRRTIVDTLGGRMLDRLSAADVARMVKDYAERGPVAANRLLTNTKLFLRWCVESGYMEKSPASDISTRIAGGSEVSRERVLTDYEIRRLWHVEAAHTRLLRFLLLTGARIGEAQLARWRDIHGNRWTIPAENAKNGRAHWVHLAPLALEVLGKRTQDDELALRCASETAVQAWLRRWCEREQIDPRFTPHDLRRSFATRMAGIGIPPHVTEKLLGHLMQGVMGIYNRAEYEPERVEALEKWAREVARLARAK